MLEQTTASTLPALASAVPEPITGEDAIFLNLERPDTPTHTLKVVVLDPARRGAQVTLADLYRVIPDYLALTPRSTQRVGRMPNKSRRSLAWVADESFDLANHLDERIVAAPGDRAALDQICADLSVLQLDRSRPLWSMTLVHGLAEGRQAVVVRVHHAIADGLASINLLTAVTSEEPGFAVEPGTIDRATTPHVSASGRFSDLVRAARASRDRTRAFGSRAEIPSGLTGRTIFNTRSGADRLCVSGTFELADLKLLAKSAGVTLNGALHAVIAGAMREELIERGESSDRPLVATFGVVQDSGPSRLHGNGIATASAYLRADLADPLDRLRETARSCLLSVGLRRARGFDLHREGTHFARRVAPLARAAFADLTPGVTNHITTANVPGPATSRWFGNVEVVDWISFSLAIAPADVNLTAYSYAGRMTIGLVVTPESMPDPQGFLVRVEQSLAMLLAALREDQRALSA